MRNAPIAALALFLAATAAPAAPAAAQSAQDVLNTAMERFEQRVSNIDDYTVVQNAMGSEVVLYYEKQIVEGKPVFTARTISAGDMSMGDMGNTADMFSEMSTVAEHATYLGREDVDGHSTHAIRIEEAGMSSWTASMAQGAGDDFSPKTMTMFIDAGEYVPRRMVLVGESTQDGQTQTMTATVDFTDYREVEGFLHPFSTTFSIEGMPPGMSEEDIEEARQQLAEFEKQMADMPESQRAMVERMMGDRMKSIREMLESGGTSFSVETKEVRVNTGPPGGF
jgi:hypothetical protein